MKVCSHPLALPLVLATLLTSFGGACAGGRERLPSVPDAGVDPSAVLAGLDHFIDELSRAMCAQQFRCCTLPEIVLLGRSSYLDESECRTRIGLELDHRLWYARVAVSEGRLTIDATIAGECVQTFDKGACGVSRSLSFDALSGLDPWATFSDCRDPFVGRGPVGSPCLLSDECVAGSRCRGPGPVADEGDAWTSQGINTIDNLGRVSTSQGFCDAYAQEGGNCLSTSECAPRLYCRKTDFRCARPVALGQGCGSAFAPNVGVRAVVACDSSHWGAVCAADNVCRRLPRAGEPCLDPNLGESSLPRCDPDPALGLSCVGGENGDTGVCLAAGGLGSSCLGDGDGLAPCAAGLACLPDEMSGLGTCEIPPLVGEPCSLDSRCAPPAVCDVSLFKCLVPGRRRDGQTCAKDEDCASLTCQFNDAGTMTCGTILDQALCIGPGPAPTRASAQLDP